jgi:hypothetical protein
MKCQLNILVYDINKEVIVKWKIQKKSRLIARSSNKFSINMPLIQLIEESRGTIAAFGKPV